MQVQVRNEMVEKKKVYYTGTDVLHQGYALCYDADRGTATAVDDERAYMVEQPATANFQNFAGLVTERCDGVRGPATVEIYVPTARGQKVIGWSGANNTIDSTELRLKNGSYEVDTDGTGPIVARAMQTVNRSTTSGPVQVLLLGANGGEMQSAVAALTNDGAATLGAANGAFEDQNNAVTGVDGTGSNAASKADVDARLVSIGNNMQELATQVETLRARLVAAGIIAA